MNIGIALAPVVRTPDPHSSQGGAYGARRTRGGEDYGHKGLDIRTFPGQKIIATQRLFVVRLADPYPDAKDAKLLGLWVRTDDGVMIKILYIDPDEMVIGKMVEAGTVLGVAQSLQHLYPGAQDHIHVEVYDNQGDRQDPTPFFATT